MTAPPRILIVEDEFLIAMTAEEALEEAGFTVVGIADTYEAAIRLAEECRPHLVIMDIRLKSPKDGIDAAAEIRRRYGIGSLFTSGNQDPSNLDRAASCDPVGWLPKPYLPEELVEWVRQTLR